MNWIALKSLNEVYSDGKTQKKTTLVNDPYINYLIKNTKELREDSKYLHAATGFREHYESKLLPKFQQYSDFLIETGLLKPQTRFEESDIIILIEMHNGIKNEDLNELRSQIIEAEESVRGVSLMFFRYDKYLEGKPALVDAVKKILSIEQFANDKDQQYKYVLECKTPKCIVLCENSDFLKRPALPRKNNIELWYAGGRNIDKLDYSNTRSLPIYYSCDWDYDGLLIFEAVKEKIKDIILLYPTGQPKGIIATKHKSLWPGKSLSDLYSLNVGLFNLKEQTLIKSLLENDQWIIEESNNLIEMVNTKNLI